MSELTPAQKRKSNANEFQRKYGQYWLVYAALIFTAVLSASAGLLLPFQPDATGYILVTLPRIIAAIFYAIGFLTTGELASNFWFEKLTDHDKDNTGQKVIAILMLTVAVITSLVTSLAAGAMIAYMLDVLETFQVMPIWAQKWVVWAIPIMWVAHAVSGMAFKAVSDEATADRDAASVIRDVKNTIIREKAEARADYWKVNASTIAKQLGELEGRKEVEDYTVRLNSQRGIKPPSLEAVFNSDTVRIPEIVDNSKNSLAGKPNS